MKKDKQLTPFPWNYYIRTVQGRVVLVILTTFISIIVIKRDTEYLVAELFVCISIIIILAFIYGYFRIKPFRKILGRIEDIQAKLPNHQKLSYIYQKNEWSLVHEALDLTENYINKQSEKVEELGIQSDTLIETIPNPIILIDNFQNLVKYNHIFKDKFIGNKDATILNDEKLWKIFKEDQVCPSFDKVIKEESKSEKLYAEYFPEINEFFDIAITPLKNSKGEINGALGIFHNVTEAKLTEKMRVDFVANVSHEIRTPLTSIKGYTQLLQAQEESAISPNLAPVLEKIVNNTERLKDLFDNLLKLSIIESQNDLTKQSLNIENLLNQVIGGIKGKYLDRDISFNKEFMDKDFHADPKLFVQVVTNIIDNAIKYGPSAIVIDATSRNSNDSFIITIADNGPGISEEDLKRIFERFYRVQGISQTAIEGTGLGLSIVKHIINKHGGVIEVESRIGEGTTFTISLPIS